MVKRHEEERYYESAVDWNEELYHKAKKNLRWTVCVCMVFALALLGSVIAVVYLSATQKPYVHLVEVNSITGETHLKAPVNVGDLMGSEVLKKYWITKYVNARLTYDFQDFKEMYTLVKHFSDRPTFKDYAVDVNPKADDSRYQQHGDSLVVKTNVRSISFLDKDTASVRLDLETKKRGGAVEIRPYIATLGFMFTASPTNEATRAINPLGFKIIRWRLDSEIPTSRSTPL